jgi:hypothetical protein
MKIGKQRHTKSLSVSRYRSRFLFMFMLLFWSSVFLLYFPTSFLFIRVLLTCSAGTRGKERFRGFSTSSPDGSMGLIAVY